MGEVFLLNLFNGITSKANFRIFLDKQSYGNKFLYFVHNWLDLV